MKTWLSVALILVAISSSQAWADSGRAAWSADTAELLPEGRWEAGLFGPARTGLSGDLELQAHPVWALLAPHLGVKWQHHAGERWVVSTRHTLSYPTPLLSVLAREGTGGVVPVDTQVPHILNLTQDALVTLKLPRSQRLTGRAGARLAVAIGENTLPTIDLPVVYPRGAAWHEGLALEAGIAWTGRAPRWLAYGVSLDLFWMPGLEAGEPAWHHAVEVTPHLTWYISESWSLMGVVKVVEGSYPFGEQSHLLPILDVSYGWGGGP